MQYLRMILMGVLSLVLVACGEKKPDVVLDTDGGNQLHASDWQGKWVYINYWAEWCKPCTEEIPELNAFAAENPDVLVLGVNFDKKTDVELLKQINALRIGFPVVTNDIQMVFPHTVPASLPATLVFNPKGELVDTLQGAQTRATLGQAKKL